MKLSNYFPELPRLLKQEHDLNYLINELQWLNKGQGQGSSSDDNVYRSPTLGLDMIYGSWLNQQMAYRENLVTQVIEFGRNVEEVRGPVSHIVSEVFRRGIQWKYKFASKCEKCNSEYQEDVKECDKCLMESGGEDKGKLVAPDIKQREKMNTFIQDCNIWNQSLEEVLRSLWWDVNITDDLFLYIVKEYKMVDLNGDGKPEVRSKPIELRRLNPALIEWDLDMKGLPKNSHYVCYMHRDTSLSESPGECDECGSYLVPAMYKYHYQGQVMYLLDSEIIHESKFSPTETFGFSPILTLIHKVLTIKGMDLNLYRYFYERKTPASMLMVFTDDAESLRREREHIQSRMRQDPNYIPMVAVSTKQQRGRADLIKLFHTLQEMDYLPVREEIRERIAAMWGVTPAWQSAPESVGGLSSQSQQLTVMSRVIEADQRMIHEKIFPKLLEAFGVTDWILELPQPEEKAEATRISFAMQRISAANMLVQMGFDVKIKSTEMGVDEIDFVVSGEAINMREQQEQMMGGGMGGAMPPGGGGMPPTGGDMAGGEMPMGGSDELQALPSGMESPDTSGAMAKSLQKAWDITSQLKNFGHNFPIIKQVASDSSYTIFESYGLGLFKANINPASGMVINIEKYMSPRMHRHRGMPMHDINIQHNEGMARKPKSDDMFWGPETPEDIDDFN